MSFLLLRLIRGSWLEDVSDSEMSCGAFYFFGTTYEGERGRGCCSQIPTCVNSENRGVEVHRGSESDWHDG